MLNVNNLQNNDDNFEILVNKVDSLEKELLSEKVKSRNFVEQLNKFIQNSIIIKNNWRKR